MTSAPPDLIDHLLGLDANSPLYAIRHQRDKVVAATQGSYEALFDPSLPELTRVERLAVATYACRLTPAPELHAYYLDALRIAGADATTLAFVDGDTLEDAPHTRLHTILAYTRTLILDPLAGDEAALRTLPAAGLNTPAVVALSQLIAFLSYQTRLFAGLKAMQALEELA